MTWKTRHRSFYYEGAPEPDDLDLKPAETALCSLADESFNVVVLDDCCAAGTDELHEQQLAIINMIYCHVMHADELVQMMKLK